MIMRTKILFFLMSSFCLALLGFHSKILDRKISATAYVESTKSLGSVGCSPDWKVISQLVEDTEIPPIPGSGYHTWLISTKNDSAQFYFNQGMNMYYSFHIIESMASFKKAARFDPDCSMLFWAQALAYGPNINDVGYAASPEALAAINKAVELSGKSTTSEKMLIQAMQARYSADSTQARAELNQLYADKMKEVYEKYPAHADLAALYVDALMLQHPWDLWRTDGTPRPWTPVIRDILEKLLTTSPEHPGANHYYIHVMEPSPFAAKALPSADRMGKLTPGLSHTVHMPSHIYLRTGNYERGIAVNEDAVSSYKKTIPLYSPVTANDFLYLIHNLHMQTNNAMMAGRSLKAIQTANETRKSISKDYLAIPGALGNYFQYISMVPVLVDVRFERWKELLSYPEPESGQVYSNLLYHFGRGMAHANLLAMNEARLELNSMRLLMRDSTLAIPFTPFSSAIDAALVAENLLDGTIALKDGRYNDAVVAFSKAARYEEKMVYNEPRDWLLNSLPYLGNALLKAKRWKDAEDAFRKDLSNNNENGWALSGLYQALVAQNKKSEGEKVLLRFRKAFAKADARLLKVS